MMFWEKKFSQWITRMRHQTVLPLRVILWNGLQFDLAEVTPKVTVRLPGPSSLTYLLNPSLKNLARAYVEGKLHVDLCVPDLCTWGASSVPLYLL